MSQRSVDALIGVLGFLITLMVAGALIGRPVFALPPAIVGIVIVGYLLFILGVDFAEEELK